MRRKRQKVDRYFASVQDRALLVSLLSRQLVRFLRLALPRLRLTRFPRAGTRDLARDRHPAASESTIPYVRDVVVSSEFEFDRGPTIIVSSPVSVAFQYAFFHSVGENDESIKSVVKIREGEATFSWSSFVKRCSTCNYFVTRPRLCRTAQALAGFAAR